MAYAIIFIFVGAGVAMPAINTITSNLTPRNAQGQLPGAQASMMSFTLIFSPVVMTQTLQYFTNLPATHPLQTAGAAFFLAGLICVLALIPFLIGVGVNRRAIEAALSEPAAE